MTDDISAYLQCKWTLSVEGFYSSIESTGMEEGAAAIYDLAEMPTNSQVEINENLIVYKVDLTDFEPAFPPGMPDHHNGNRINESHNLGRKATLQCGLDIWVINECLMQPLKNWKQYLAQYSTNDKRILKAKRRLQQNKLNSVTARLKKARLEEEARQTALLALQFPLDFESEFEFLL